MDRASRRLLTSALVLAAAAGLVLPGAAPAKTTALPGIKHVFVIVLENESESTSFGPSSPAPYLAKTLVSQGAFVPNYYGIAHPSLPNYIAMISGQAPDTATRGDCSAYTEFVATGPTTADGQAVGNGCVYPAAVKTLSNQLDAAGLSWRGYMDSMGADPARESAACGHPTLGAADGTQVQSPADQYATRHNPFMYFHSVIDNQTYCDSHVVPLTRLAADLASYGSTPNLSFITPGLCNDGHDAPCANGDPGGLAQANTFLSGLIPTIEASAAYKQDGLIVITFDEAEGSDATACCGEQSGPNVAQPGGTGPGGGKIGAVLLSPFIKPGTVTQTAYNHYSLLRSLEDIFGVPHLGYAGQAGLATFGSDVFTATALAPTHLTGHYRNGDLHLTWHAAPFTAYHVYRDGKPLKVRKTGAATATVPNFHPGKVTRLTVRALLSGDHTSKPSNVLLLTPLPKPHGVPRAIPAWANRLRIWENGGRHGARPHTPTPLPRWYARWKAWTNAPARIRAL